MKLPDAFQKDYLPVKGLPELREAVAEHHPQTFSIECSSENVIIGPGSKDLYSTKEVARVLGIMPDVYRYRESIGL